MAMLLWQHFWKHKETLMRTQQKNGSPFDQSKFTPDIAFILDLSPASHGNIADQKYYSLTIPGFQFSISESAEFIRLNAHRGMNFNYGELSLYSVVDPYFDLFAVIGLAPESAAWKKRILTTRKLPYGFQIKAGKFLASFGRVKWAAWTLLGFSPTGRWLHGTIWWGRDERGRGSSYLGCASVFFSCGRVQKFWTVQIWTKFRYYWVTNPSAASQSMPFRTKSLYRILHGASSISKMRRSS